MVGLARGADAHGLAIGEGLVLLVTGRTALGLVLAQARVVEQMPSELDLGLAHGVVSGHLGRGKAGGQIPGVAGVDPAVGQRAIRGGAIDVTDGARIRDRGIDLQWSGLSGRTASRPEPHAPRQHAPAGAKVRGRCLGSDGHEVVLSGQDDLAATLARIEARLERLERVLEPVSDLSGQLPAALATVTDVIDEKGTHVTAALADASGWLMAPDKPATGR